ncbi:MAG: nucleotidyltransferase domain-containing protein [Oscillospiraceae bacterium]|nr:nucleotidyltransferase domain-containing protein [Oscillospiraceae bacterium]
MTDHQTIVETIIPAKLQEIQQKENVRILHCVESGSRAWGFASPDSDYDVRFIYVRPLKYYLRLEKTRDVIEWQLDDTLDINGWDLQKALRLLHSSNPTLFEWNSAPIVYHTTEEWTSLSPIIDKAFRKKVGLHHYLSTAKKNYKEYLTEDSVKLKKYFYVLRPILACRWILEKQTVPPVLFSELCNACLDEHMVPIVSNLVRIKKETPEIGYGPRIDVLNEYLEQSIDEINEILNTLPDDSPVSWEELNGLFLHAVGVNS